MRLESLVKCGKEDLIEKGYMEGGVKSREGKRRTEKEEEDEVKERGRTGEDS